MNRGGLRGVLEIGFLFSN